jgi:hypothetical protein
VVLQSELKDIKADLRDMRLVNLSYQDDLEEAKEIININEDKIKILKAEAVHSIDNEINY